MKQNKSSLNTINFKRLEKKRAAGIQPMRHHQQTEITE